MNNFVIKQDLAKKQKELFDKIKKRRQDEIVKHNTKVKKLKLYKQLNVNFNIKDNYNSIIPLNFYTCWHTKDLPPLMKQNYDQLVLQNPEFNCHVYDENECRLFIQTNFDLDILKSYNSLIPCSYKSDLWRFCVLYINGGIYMDIKYKCVNNFKSIFATKIILGQKSSANVSDTNVMRGTFVNLLFIRQHFSSHCCLSLSLSRSLLPFVI